MALVPAKDFKEFLKSLSSNHVEYLLIGGYAVGSAITRIGESRNEVENHHCGVCVLLCILPYGGFSIH